MISDAIIQHAITIGGIATTISILGKQLLNGKLSKPVKREIEVLQSNIDNVERKFEIIQGDLNDLKVTVRVIERVEKIVKELNGKVK